MTEEIKLKDRTRWAINYVCTDRVDYKGHSNMSLGPFLGVSKDTINNYRQRNSIPNVLFIIKFCEKFNFSYEWFLFGKGEPFPGARVQFPEVCGPEQRQPVELTATITGDQTANYSTAGVDQFAQAVSQLKIIFDSRDPTIITTVLNVFGQAITERRENHRLRNLINTMEKRIAALEAGVQREGGDIQGDTTANGTSLSTEKKAG